MIEQALQALALQYPSYALWLQEAYLGRVARELERRRYREMLEQFLISGEVYADLIKQLEARWRHIDAHPSLDIELSKPDLIARVPLFEGLEPAVLHDIGKLLTPRLTLPDQRIMTQGKAHNEMYFVASGAVSVHLPDGTEAELGSGEFFGELALLGHGELVPQVTSLGYTKLLILSQRDFEALLDRDPQLRSRIESVAKQRLRAVEVWRQFSAHAQASEGESGQPG